MKLNYRHVSLNNVFTLDKKVNQLAKCGYVCDGPIVVTVVSPRVFMYTQRMKKEPDYELKGESETPL